MRPLHEKRRTWGGRTAEIDAFSLPRCAPAPLRIGTARDFCHSEDSRHSALALPGILGKSHSGLALPKNIGVAKPLAAQFWHCQGFLASGSFSSPNVGSARNLWSAEGFHRPAPDIKKAPLRELSGLPGGPSGVRTPDLGIKSPLLCQLS